MLNYYYYIVEIVIASWTANLFAAGAPSSPDAFAVAYGS
jgi:hypothetical protein